MPTPTFIAERLAAAHDDLFRRYPLRRLAFFGSSARGEATPDSDIDVLVEFREPVGFEVADLAEDLETLLGQRVDLVTRGAIRPALWAHIERDLIDV